MTTVSTAPLPLAGRRIQIAGSASASTDPALVRYGHEVIARLVPNIITAGGGIVVGAGREPRPDGAAVDALDPYFFDWTALDAAARCIQQGCGTWPAGSGLPDRRRLVRKSRVRNSRQSRRSLYDHSIEQRPGTVRNPLCPARAQPHSCASARRCLRMRSSSLVAEQASSIPG